MDSPGNVCRWNGRRAIRATRSGRYLAQSSRRSAVPEAVYLAATDPANPYGSLLPWPRSANENSGEGGEQVPMLARAAGASVILVDGTLAAYLRRRNPSVAIFLPEQEPERSHYAQELAKKLAELALRRQTRRGGLLIGSINGAPAREHFMARYLEEFGFVNTSLGFQMRRVAPISLAAPAETVEPEDDELPGAETA
jgi:ATP-dependent helicase Lhr and Lhr-like helicase